MRKIEDYEQCQVMARNTSNEEQRIGLMRMAETWEGLARDRHAQLARQKRIDALHGDEPA
jgi:hypothetical protein